MWQNGKNTLSLQLFKLQSHSSVNGISSSFPPSRVYRACLQRTSLVSLLSGALLEAIAALGARSALPYPLPQGTGNSHAVLKGGYTRRRCCLCVWPCKAWGRRVTTKDKWIRGIMGFILRRRVSHYSPVVYPFFPGLLSHMVFLSTVVVWVNTSTSVIEDTSCLFSSPLLCKSSAVMSPFSTLAHIHSQYCTKRSQTQT